MAPRPILGSLLMALAVIAVPLLAACSPSSTPAPAATLPSIVTIASSAIGSANNVSSTGLAEAITRQSKMKARVTPLTTANDQLMALRDKSAELAQIASSTTIPAYLALLEYEDPKNWGPQPLRMVFAVNMAPAGIFVRGDSGIKNVSDLKGKRVPYFTGWAGGLKSLEGMLAFGNVTYNDVTKVPMPSSAGAYDAILEGTIDVSYGGQNAPKALELAAGSHKIWWPPMPSSDTAGWKKVQDIAPWVTPAQIPASAAPGTLSQMAVVNALIALDFADENVIYEATKALATGYDVFKDMHPDLKTSTLETTLTIPVPTGIPYHPGAVRYFKEVSKWTPALDERQQKALKAEKERMDAFKAKK